ncbi:MAG: hypothetical protein AAB445_03250 [Patescibacteria group bacterium]
MVTTAFPHCDIRYFSTLEEFEGLRFGKQMFNIDCAVVTLPTPCPNAKLFLERVRESTSHKRVVLVRRPTDPQLELSGVDVGVLGIGTSTPDTEKMSALLLALMAFESQPRST